MLITPKKNFNFVLLIAEDDQDDQDLLKEAFEPYASTTDLKFVSDGEECWNYLQRQGPYADPVQSPRPDFILLDLNMPRKSGKEVLREIKNDPDLKRIPVLILTTSQSFNDIQDAYNLGSNSYLIKPNTFKETVQLIQRMSDFWFSTAQLPSQQ